MFSVHLPKRFLSTMKREDVSECQDAHYALDVSHSPNAISAIFIWQMKNIIHTSVHVLALLLHYATMTLIYLI